jgi:hypothetical protein
MVDQRFFGRVDRRKAYPYAVAGTDTPDREPDFEKTPMFPVVTPQRPEEATVVGKTINSDVF